MVVLQHNHTPWYEEVKGVIAEQKKRATSHYRQIYRWTSFFVIVKVDFKRKKKHSDWNGAVSRWVSITLNRKVARTLWITLFVRIGHSLRVMSLKPDLEGNDEVIIKHIVQSWARRVSKRPLLKKWKKNKNHSAVKDFVTYIFNKWCKWEVRYNLKLPLSFRNLIFLQMT